MEYTEEIIQEYLDEEYYGEVIIYDHEFRIDEVKEVINLVCVVERFIDVDDTDHFIEKFQIDLETFKDWADAR
jgi:hypothetical protein